MPSPCICDQGQPGATLEMAPRLQAAPFTFAAVEPETLETRLFAREEIPWDSLAFSRCYTPAAAVAAAAILPCPQHLLDARAASLRANFCTRTHRSRSVQLALRLYLEDPASYHHGVIAKRPGRSAEHAAGDVALWECVQCHAAGMPDRSAPMPYHLPPSVQRPQ